MLPAAGGRRLVLLVRRAAAAADAGRPNPLQPPPQTDAARLPNHYYSSAPRAKTPDLDIASYLVASCGLSPAAAAALSSRGIRVSSTSNADAVLALLRRHGFFDAQIARVLRLCPTLLVSDPDKIVRSKLEFLASLGLPVAVVSNRVILHRSLEKHLVPSVDFLRGILGSDANIRKAVASHRYGLLIDLNTRMRPAVEALRRHGFTEKDLSRLLTIQIWALRMTPNRIDQVCKDLEAIGLPITDSRFPFAFRAMCSLSKDRWLRKVALYQSFGVSEGELLAAFKKVPTIMLLSEKNIEEKLRFFLDVMKLEASDVMRRPVVMGCSLEKSILPRCAALSVLMEEGKIGRNFNVLTALVATFKNFLKQYVLSYADDVPDVVKAYEGKIKFKGFQARDA